MTAGLSSPRGSNIDDEVASTFRFVLAVESVVCTCVVLFLTWKLSFVGFHSNPSLVEELIFLKTGQLIDNSMFRPLLGIHWIHVTYSFGFPHEIVVLILEFLYQSTFKICSLRSAARREDPSCLGSIFVGSLKTDPPSSCWVVCVMTCCLETCCSVVMVDGSKGSTSLERFKLCSSLLSSRSRNVG